MSVLAFQISSSLINVPVQSLPSAHFSAIHNKCTTLKIRVQSERDRCILFCSYSVFLLSHSLLTFLSFSFFLDGPAHVEYQPVLHLEAEVQEVQHASFIFPVFSSLAGELDWNIADVHSCSSSVLL